MYDIIIIGAGPAGLTAALYAKRARAKVLVLEAKTYGGQIINAMSIENYPGLPNITGFDFATTLYNQVTSLGVEIKYEVVSNISVEKVVTTNKNKYEAKSIIIATGSSNKKLNIKNEINLIGKGISYCATCDGNFYKDKIVAVVGGGNTALEDAIYLSNIAKKVYLIHRRDEFRADELIQNKINTINNIEIITNYNISNINGENLLDSIDITDNDNNTRNIKIDGLFIAIGQVPNNKYFSSVVDIDEFGYIISPDGLHTKTEKIYVAGDTRQKELRQLTTAISDGALAATTAIKEIME